MICKDLRFIKWGTKRAEFYPILEFPECRQLISIKKKNLTHFIHPLVLFELLEN